MSLIVRHIIIELHHCHYEQLDDPHFLEETLFALTDILKTEVKAKATYHFDPHGVTSILIVGASHISIHTWPEYEYANIDLVVCTTNFAMSDIIVFLKDRFATEQVDFMEVQRSTAK